MTSDESVVEILERITRPLRNSIQAQYIAKRTAYFQHASRDKAIITTEAIELFDSDWERLETRLAVVPGKDVLNAFREALQSKYGVTLTDYRIIDEFRSAEVPADLLDLLKSLEDYRSKNKRNHQEDPDLDL